MRAHGIDNENPTQTGNSKQEGKRTNRGDPQVEDLVIHYTGALKEIKK